MVLKSYAELLLLLGLMVPTCLVSEMGEGL